MEGVIKVFDTSTFRLCGSFRAEDREISLVLLDPSGRFLAVAADRSFSLYDFASGTLINRQEFDAPAEIRCIYFFDEAAPTPRILYCSARFGVYVLCGDLRAARGTSECFCLEPRRRFVEATLIGPQGFAAVTDDGSVYYWRLDEQKPKSRRPPGRLLPLSAGLRPGQFENFLVSENGALVLVMHKAGLAFFSGALEPPTQAANQSEQNGHGDPVQSRWSGPSVPRLLMAPQVLPAAPRGLRNLTAPAPSCPPVAPRRYDRVHELRLRKVAGPRGRTCASALNARFALVAFNTTENSEANQEEFKSKTEIYIFDVSDPRRVSRLHSITEENCKLNLSVSVFCIEPCGFRPEIFAVGDSEGQVVLWDAARGVPLFVAREFCAHLPGQSAVSNPICDVKFLPGRMEFYASTFYGAISFYANTRSDFAESAPGEQFTPADFAMPDPPCLLDAGATAQAEPQNADELRRVLFETAVDARRRKAEIENNRLEFEAFYASEEEKLAMKLTRLSLAQSQVLQKALPPAGVDAAELPAENAEAEEAEPQAAAAEPRIDPPRRTRPRIEADDDEDEEEAVEPPEPRHQFKSPRLKKIYENSASNDSAPPRTEASSARCFHCAGPAGETCGGCELSICAACLPRFTSANRVGSWRCIQCLLSDTHSPSHTPAAWYGTCIRGLFSSDSECFFIPQVRDRLFFIGPAFGDFVRRHWSRLPPETHEAAWRLLQIDADVKVVVVNYEFAFPIAAARRGGKESVHIFQVIKLKVVETGEEWIVPYIPPELNDLSDLFLVPKSLYLGSISSARKLTLGDTFSARGRHFVFHSFEEQGQSLFNSVQVSEPDSRRMSLRKTDFSRMRISPWEAAQPASKSSPAAPSPILIEKIKSLAEIHCEFAEDVDKRMYPDYSQTVEVEMNLGKLAKRIKEGYFRSLDELKKQIVMIRENAEKYNQSDSDIVCQAGRLERQLIQAVNRAADSIEGSLKKRDESDLDD